MAYELHIGKRQAEMRLDDWKSAVERLEGVRLVSQEHSITNPATDEVITLPYRDGDTEVFCTLDGIRRPAFTWYNGNASFRANFSPGDLSNPVWRAAVALARTLEAAVWGDNGELYDLDTGDVIHET